MMDKKEKELKAIEFLKSKGYELCEVWALSHDELAEGDSTVFFDKADFINLLQPVKGFWSDKYEEFKDEDLIDELLEREEYDGDMDF